MTLHAGAAPAGDGAADDKVVGSITSAAWSPELGAWAALGYLHRTVDAPGPVRVRSGEGIGASWPARVAERSRWSPARRAALILAVPAAARDRRRAAALLLAPPTRCRRRDDTVQLAGRPG